MYAIVLTGGKQYKVQEGQYFETELLEAEVGSKVELEVLLVANDEKSLVAGQCDNCKVIGSIMEHGKGKKLNIFTYKAKKNVRKRKGHRQPYTKIMVESIVMA